MPSQPRTRVVLRWLRQNCGLKSGVRLEKGQTTPTMKQKTIFILKACGIGETARKTATDAVAAVVAWTTVRIMWNSAVAWKYATGAERVFFWLAAETGLRAGELIALRVSDVDVEKLAVEVSKAIWNGSEDNPKTEAAFRSICISSRLGSQVREYLADRVDGYLFQTSSGNPWNASNVLERKLNALLERLEIPKIDIQASSEVCWEKRNH